jgi:hypothetical protein
MKKTGIIISAAALSVAPACAGVVLPGPEMGDSVPGLAVVVVLAVGYFLFRYYRKRSHS